MSLLPNKNLIIVTSALKPVIGAVSDDDRYKQTIDSLVSLRKHFPDDFIFFTDGSPKEIEKEKLEEISKYADVVACWHHDEEIRTLAGRGQKSEAEIVLLVKTLSSLLQNPSLQKMMYEVKRIFKFSARTVLHDSFDIKEYDYLYGKYVFKTRIPSWLPEEKQKQTTDHLLITRMYSFCPSLLTDYFNVLINSFKDVHQYNIDTEHAHYKNIDKDKLVEMRTIHCEGIMGGTGAIETY